MPNSDLKQNKKTFLFPFPKKHLGNKYLRAKLTSFTHLLLADLGMNFVLKWIWLLFCYCKPSNTKLFSLLT